MVLLPIVFAGIFAYLNYLTPKSRKEILEFLVTGLKRLEYRGYDSAGVAVDNPLDNGIILVKQQGKVKALEDAIITSKCNLSTTLILPGAYTVLEVKLPFCYQLLKPLPAPNTLWYLLSTIRFNRQITI